MDLFRVLSFILIISLQEVKLQCPLSGSQRVSRQALGESSIRSLYGEILNLVVPSNPLNESDPLEKLLVEAAQETRNQIQETQSSLVTRFLRGGSFQIRQDSFATVASATDEMARVRQAGALRDGISRYVAEKTGDTASLRNISLRNTALEYLCISLPPCERSLYRAYNGNCNNLHNPTWGMAFSEFARLLPHDYVDGLSSPRGSDPNRPLPNARRISFTVHPGAEYLMEQLNDLWASVLFFLIQDTCGSVSPAGILFSFAECCTPEVLRNPELRHPNCMPIPIPENDPFYTQYEETCMHFVRHAGGPTSACTLGPRQHSNFRSSYIDGAGVYGNEEDVSSLIRQFQGGRQRSVIINGREYPPSDNGPFLGSHLPDSGCYADPVDRESICVLSGDFLNSESIHGASLHTLYLRQHNSIADRLAKLNPHWDDEKIYQETRKIVAAQYQIMVYDELLAPLLGPNYMTAYNLTLNTEGHFNGYDPEVNAALTDEFCEIGLQLGHSTFPSRFNVRMDDGAMKSVAGTNVIFRSLNTTEMDNYILGGVYTRTPAVDGAVSSLLSSQTFPRADRRLGMSQNFGVDTIAQTIQRGRDRGIPPYIRYRKFCNLESAMSFDDLKQWMPDDSVKRLRAVYVNVDDIDAFPGIMSELPTPGSLVGPTMACVLGEQFRRLKIGDRFWFENGGMPHSFTPDQLREIRKTSLSRFICDFSNGIQEMPVHAMMVPSESNPVVDCGDLRIVGEMDLIPWKDPVLE